MPIFHECERCTACCRWPGQVRLSGQEITRLAGFLQISEIEFIQRYTRLAKDRRGLALEEKPNGECIFLDGNDCAVQPVKPRQCRAFPNLWNFPGFEIICQARPLVVSEDEYRRRLAGAMGKDQSGESIAQSPFLLSSPATPEHGTL
jgi:uncharacterized protein